MDSGNQPRVRAVLTGSVSALGQTTSGIDKRPRDGRQRVDVTGIVGDAQADLRVHGGPDKAVLCYAWSHYEAWRRELPGHALLDAPGAFGENLSVDGLDEGGVCLGDRYDIGSARFVVTQGRQPCFKLNLRFDVPDMSRRVQHSGRVGWYLRVETVGDVCAGDPIVLVERPHPSHSVADIMALIGDRDVRPDRLRPVLDLPLTPGWRRLFERRLEHGAAEDWTRRLQGSAPERDAPAITPSGVS